ncbi:MAG: L-ribulose-5-phosphate 4-epimerase AraD [Ignavibacteriae bacterium]|nr:MAG: L-ribulose-5-phosphate 4-epimerase AraD [Ignavibacteriota bacterium]
MIKQLKEEVCAANIDLQKLGLVTLTWGNVSGRDAGDNLVVIKPSGVPYHSLRADDMVVVDLSGKIMEGNRKPSSDTPTHLKLYNAFPKIGGITHTHSTYATMFAQACREIPCLGTTHADQFNGPVPVTRFLTEEEVYTGYEMNTGTAIIERFANLDVLALPAVLVAGHAPFTWGTDASDSVRNALALERIAQMALGTLQLDPGVNELPRYIREKHFKRKHGPDAYYGQK